MMKNRNGRRIGELVGAVVDTNLDVRLVFGCCFDRKEQRIIGAIAGDEWFVQDALGSCRVSADAY